jgi:glycosyltransferase involved in cell wall biosynthesis
VFEKVDYMTVVGAPMYEIALREGLSAEKLQIAPMGVDFDGKFVPLAELRCETPRVLFVGRLVRSKGAHLLLAAVEKLAAQAFNFSVDIAGDGPELENLEEEADARGVRGQVIFHGFQAGSDLVKLYQAADVVVVPSTQPEGLGLVTLEAMGCASAVLAPDFEINRTLLTHDVTGILYKAGDVESLAGCLAELLRNRKKREDIGLNARNWAVDHYGINSASERYILIMKRLIQAASTNPPPYNPSSAPQ